MGVIAWDCKEDAVYWPKAGDDSVTGQPYVTDGSEEAIKVRWVPSRRTSLDAKGNQIVTEIQIAASQELTLDGIVWYGSEGDLPDTDELTDLYVIKAEKKAKDVGGGNTRYEYGLMRFMDRLPVAS